MISKRKDCVFCEIIDRHSLSEILLENKSSILIKDKYPKAPVHLLLISKQHYSNLLDNNFEWNILLEIEEVIKVLTSLGVKSFKLIINNGKEVGQEIDHFHIHFISSNIK